MTPVLLRAAPWPALLALSTAGAVTGVLASALQGAPALRLLQCALVLLGAAGACALDDPAAAVTAACPVSRARQVAARVGAATVPLLVGTALLAGWSLGKQVDRLLVVQLTGCWLLGLGLAVLARLRLDEPAELVAAAMLMLLLTTMFVDAVGSRLVLFPLGGQLQRGVRTWELLMAGCAIALVLAVRERRWSH
ncbi:MAG TPA: hypothetical protein VMZ11_04140 [Mycobacteriales bacterium]|nr:hypothetical protein [Mycobacteriales bacterium]